MLLGEYSWGSNQQEMTMTKQTGDISEQKKDELKQQQQDVSQSQQRAEEAEVAGRHRQDGMLDHQGKDKGPRGQ